MRDNAILTQGALEMGVSLNEQQLQQFETYYDILVEQNQVMNLTAITEYEEVLTKHFLDSMLAVKTGLSFENKRVLDLGSGAGFPGIPLKILFPKTEFVLMDSLGKRVTFLNKVIAELGLTNICAVHGRAEEEARKEEYRESFDLCVSRAVARLSSLAEFCVPFVKKGGIFLSYKAEDCEQECKEAERAVNILCQGKIQSKKIALPKTDMSRVFVMVEKKAVTPEKYPRGQGKPLKQPL